LICRHPFYPAGVPRQGFALKPTKEAF